VCVDGVGPGRVIQKYPVVFTGLTFFRKKTIGRKKKTSLQNPIMTATQTRRACVLETLYQARTRALEGIRVANPALGRDMRLVNLSRSEGKSVKEAVELMNWIRMMKQYRVETSRVVNTRFGEDKELTKWLLLMKDRNIDDERWVFFV